MDNKIFHTLKYQDKNYWDRKDYAPYFFNVGTMRPHNQLNKLKEFQILKK